MLEKVLYVANFETYEPAFLRCLARLQEVGCRDLVLVHLPKTDELLRHIPGLLREGLRRCLDEVIQQQFDGYMQLCQEHGIAARCIVKEGELAWLEVRQLTQQEDRQPVRGE